MNKQKILIITGMTGVGKSSIAHLLSKVLKSSIIIGDSI